MLDCSIVVCTYRRAQELARCLASIRDAALPPTSELIVVDNSDGDKESRELSQEFRVKYLIEPRRGLSWARNCGVKNAFGRVIAFVDDDATVSREWLLNLLAPFTSDAIGAVAGRILPASNEGSGALDLGGLRKRLDTQQPAWRKELMFHRFGYGGNLAIRARIFEKCTFDVHLGRGAPIPVGEDNDILLKVVRLGYAVVYEPEAVIYHADPELENTEQVLAGYQARASFILYSWINSPSYRRSIFEYVASAKMESLPERRRIGVKPSLLQLVGARLRGIAIAFQQSRRTQPRSCVPR